MNDNINGNQLPVQWVTMTSTNHLDELIQWLERQAKWYETMAEHCWDNFLNPKEGSNFTPDQEQVRYAVYNGVSGDLRIKVMELKALHPCPTTP